MNVLVSSCARLFKAPDGTVYTPAVYGYDFYKRYLAVFDEVTVAGFCDNVDEKAVEGMICVSGPKVSFWELPYPHGEWDYIAKRRTIQKMIRRKKPDFDLIILRVPETLCFLLMERAIRDKMVFGVEVTSDPLNLYTKKTCPSRYRLVYKYYYNYKLRQACKYATGTSYVTQYGLQAHYPPSGRPGTFTTFYTDTDIKIDGSMPIRKLPKDRYVRLIHVAVSIDGFAKGHKEAIRAFGELVKQGCNVELVLVGGGELAAENRAYIRENCLEKRIIFTGQVTPAQVIEQLDQADIFFFPSYNEGLPRVVVEAMSRALPAVATDIPAHHELLPPEYLAPVENVDRLVEIVRSLLDDPARYEQASRINLEKAKEYDIDLIVAKRMDYYRQLKDAAEKRKGGRR